MNSRVRTACHYANLLKGYDMNDTNDIPKAQLEAEITPEFLSLKIDKENWRSKAEIDPFFENWPIRRRQTRHFKAGARSAAQGQP